MTGSVIAASALAQSLYYTLLAATCRGGELSHAYPLVRGCAPPLMALAGLFTGGHLGPAQWLALGLVCAGVLAIFLDASRSAPAGYTMWLLAATALVALALSSGCERHALAAFVRRRPAILLGGAMSAGSYGIALWAMTQAPVALVAALRETSILFARPSRRWGCASASARCARWWSG
jgi:multidrug transporter EmrE-like cation transporter